MPEEQICGFSTVTRDRLSRTVFVRCIAGLMGSGPDGNAFAAVVISAVRAG